jgi:hypothetical protein
MSPSCCRNLGIFGALVFMLWIFVHTWRFYPLLLLMSFWCLTCSSEFLYRWRSHRSTRLTRVVPFVLMPFNWRVSPYFVGDSQWGWLHYAAAARGGFLLGPWCSLRPHDRDCATPARALGVGRLEHDVLLSLRCRVDRVRGHADPPDFLRAAPRQGDAHYTGVVPGHGPTW